MDTEKQTIIHNLPKGFRPANAADPTTPPARLKIPSRLKQSEVFLYPEEVFAIFLRPCPPLDPGIFMSLDAAGLGGFILHRKAFICTLQRDSHALLHAEMN